MELTIEQALQQGVAAHKEGRLQDAEKLYRAILQSQPNHPDANHNLGVLAVSVNKADAALPLLKTALKANPKIEQFWLSYIDALIKEKQFENAKNVIEQAKKQGVGEEKLNILETKLTPTVHMDKPKLDVQNKSLSSCQKRKKLSAQRKSKKKQKQNVDGISPSPRQLSSLLGFYHSGRFSDAETLATTISKNFPKHNVAWKVLGAVLGETGRKSEAVDANKTAVALSPEDASAHSNLGNSLKELGMLAEAEACYMQALALKPDYAQAHSNLGVTLQELGRLDEAVASHKRALERKPDLLKAYDNIGFCYQAYIWADFSGKSKKINSLEEAVKLEKKKLVAKLKECPLWFVDIPRTSSKTISHMMWSQFGFPFGGRNLKGEDKIIETTSLLLQNHTHAFIAKHVIGDEIWKELQTFTIVRNPYDWCSSLWHYCKENETPDVTHDTFLLFLDSLDLNLQTDIYNREINHKSFLQTDYLLDEDGKILVKHVLPFEDREKITRELRSIGINCSSEIHINKSKNSDYKMSDFERKRVEQIFAKDFEILGY